MNYAAMHSIATVAAFLAFIGICWWAYRPANRERFEADGRLPIDTDPILSSVKKISGKEKGE
ncbi:MAG: cbb3-type cytochrome c oxidase subunit 3 [Pedobacter sp.]|nr:cbb3-type cytochrome c oxidase subunit 3 [Pedobacter sp.]